jgi:hypothetical protein
VCLQSVLPAPAGGLSAFSRESIFLCCREGLVSATQYRNVLKRTFHKNQKNQGREKKRIEIEQDDK